jgi:uncharacterized protein YdgA (DUF945 family)
MKKAAIAIAGLLLLAVVVAFGLTFYFSYHAEKKVAEWTQKISETAPALKVTSEYQRGLLTSTQRLTVGFPGAKGGNTGIVMKNVIHHGPFPGFKTLGMATIDHSWEFDEATQRELAKGFGTASPIAATTKVAFDASGITEFNGAPASYASGEEKVAWQGLTGTLRFTRNMDSYTGDFVAPQLSVTGKQGGMEIKGLAIKADQRRMPGFEDMYLGKMAFTMESASARDATTDTRLEKLVIDADATSADNQFMDVKAAFKVAKVATADFEASDVEYAFSMKHLHAQSLAQLTKAVRDSQPKPGAAPTDTAALQAQMAAMQKAMKLHGLALLKNDPVIAIDSIKATMKDGEIKAGGTLRLPGVTEADIDQPFMLLGKIDAAASVSMPEVFARNQFAQSRVKRAKALGTLSDTQMTEVAATAGSEFAQMLATFGQQGYVESEGGVLKTRISFKGGALLVNDKPFNPMAVAPPAAPPAVQQFAPPALSRPAPARPPLPPRR